MSTRETVPRETPASRATSWIVGGLRLPPVLLMVVIDHTDGDAKVPLDSPRHRTAHRRTGRGPPPRPGGHRPGRELDG
ncbi:hypothetical protein ACFYOV_26250 [Streptomyces sp. NPDC005931]|uniref:hypothetical protein n=1 Tax=Streptomyces sp. NPDC005931 TaxID=3364737 RepID=UPI0036BD1F5D